MKKLLPAIAMLLFVMQAANAQTEKGNQTLGFNLSYAFHNSYETEISTFDNSTSVAHTRTTNFGIGPDYSYFIANNLDLGASLQYSYFIENDYPINNMFGEKITNNSFSGTIYLRKYFMCSKKLGLRAGPYLLYSSEDDKNVSTGSTADPANDLNTRTKNFNAGVNMALVYFPSKKLGFSAMLASLDYDHYKSNDTPTGDHETGDNLNFNFINDGLSLSVFYVFGGK